jgi:cell cycle sensor histidine kinase DivJ
VVDSESDEAPKGAVAPAAHADLARDGRAWFVAWLSAVALTLAILAIIYPQTLWPVAPALFVGGLPAAVALMTRRHQSRRARRLMLILWAVAGGLACSLAGGVAGPLAAWCLAPVAAAAAQGGGRRLAESAALALVAGAVSAVAALAGFTPPPPTGMVAFWMGLLALTTTGLGLGVGLIMIERQVNRREVRLDDEVERLRAVLEEQPHLVMSLYPHGRVRVMFGRTPPGVSRETLQAIGLGAVALSGADRGAVLEGLRRASADGAAEVGFTPVGAMDRWIAVTLRRVEENLILAVMRDATAERDRQASLEQARQDAESLAAGKARFLANMSHELRTPLNAIMGFSDIMRARMFGPLPDKYSEYGDLIHESGGHLLDLINDVLDMSKIEAERFELSRESFDAREAVSAALRLLRVQADGAGVSLRGVLPQAALEVHADRRAIKQIVLNLVSNALKFTPKGGSVTVTVQGYDGDFELVVADTGVGISAQDLARLGRPYEQAGDASHRQMGTGLGLSLVRSFAELHGGDMVIESTVGEGTSVTVRLPVLERPERGAPPPLGDNVIAFNPQR